MWRPARTDDGRRSLVCRHSAASGATKKCALSRAVCAGQGWCPRQIRTCAPGSGGRTLSPDKCRSGRCHTGKYLSSHGPPNASPDRPARSRTSRSSAFSAGPGSATSDHGSPAGRSTGGTQPVVPDQRGSRPVPLRVLVAVQSGEAFDDVTGEPVSWQPLPDQMQAHAWARRWLAEQWPEWAPRTRVSAVEALTRLVPLLVAHGSPPPACAHPLGFVALPGRRPAWTTTPRSGSASGVSSWDS